MPTTIEKIALVVHPVWTYYHQKLSRSIPPKSLQDYIASGKIQQIVDALPHLTRPEAGFLGLVMDIISGDNPLDPREASLNEHGNFCESVQEATTDVDMAARRDDAIKAMIGILHAHASKGGVLRSGETPEDIKAFLRRGPSRGELLAGLVGIFSRIVWCESHGAWGEE